MKIPAIWTDDCQGKKNFDSDIVSISSRYWPPGGGFSSYDSMQPEKGFRTNEDQSIRPSAMASVLLRHDAPFPDGDSVTLICKHFDGNTEKEVRACVEAWAQEQYERVIMALRKEFDSKDEDNVNMPYSGSMERKE